MSDGIPFKLRWLDALLKKSGILCLGMMHGCRDGAHLWIDMPRCFFRAWTYDTRQVQFLGSCHSRVKLAYVLHISNHE